jgi:glycolate oxidase
MDFFKRICGMEYVFDSDEMRREYGHDHTEDLLFLPEIVVKPANTTEVAAILKYCNDQRMPVTVRGAGTGLSGGALPVHGGVLLSMERFNRIIEIDEKNLQVTVEPGVVTEVLQNAVKEKGLFYPPDPASRGSCFIGGNVSHNSGGPKAVKYGVVKDYVLNLEVVLPSGEIIWTGANTLKNSTGYNLTQLMVGSEGTLAVITKIVLKLLPYPPFNLLLLAQFADPSQAISAVSAIFRAGITPSGLEFMERDSIDFARNYLGDVQVNIPDEVRAILLIEVDGHHLETLYRDCEKIGEVLTDYGVGEVLFADNEAQKTELWRMRRCLGLAVKGTTIYKEEDTVVPRAALPELLAGVKAIGVKYGFISVCYGHAGDGNLHVNIIKGDLTDQQWKEEIPKGIREIFHLTKSLGGTISGEHGIGYVQRPYMDIVFSEIQLDIFRRIKKVFDPNGILNPGKIF